MTEPAIHTNAATAALLPFSRAERIDAIRSDRWVNYPLVRRAGAALDALVTHPRTTRMPSLAVFADSGMGKTMLMRKFGADHPPRFDTMADRPLIPVLSLQMASRPGERRFYAQVLDALGAPHNPSARIVDLERSALGLMRFTKVQVLVIDEVHNILAGSYREQRAMLNLLRFISNDLQASLVCLGVMEAREAIQSDIQLARRFDVMTLPRWTADQSLEDCLRAILRNQPLRQKSVLTAQALRHILVATDGVTARIFRMLNRLAINAIETGEERITDEAVLAWAPAADGEAAFA
jgi:hypothetical protein